MYKNIRDCWCRLERNIYVTAYWTLGGAALNSSIELLKYFYADRVNIEDDHETDWDKYPAHDKASELIIFDPKRQIGARPQKKAAD